MLRRHSWTVILKALTLTGTSRVWVMVTITANPLHFWLKDASYLRLKNIELGYSFKQEWIRKAKLERLRIYVSAQNILTITGIDDYDPEKYGTDTRGHAYPNAKTFSVGLNITL